MEVPTVSLYENSRGQSSCYLKDGQEVTSYGHISCNLIICLGVGVSTPMFVGHSYNHSIERLKRYKDLPSIKDACPEIFEAIRFAKELGDANIPALLLSVGEVTSTGTPLLSIVMDQVEGLWDTGGYIAQREHINPYIINPDSDSLDISVQMNRPYLEIEVDFHTPSFALPSVQYRINI